MFTFLRVVDQIDKEYSTLSENDTLIVCKENHRDLRQFVSSSAEPIFTSTTKATVLAEKLPVIYFVTPTYPRREQIAELTRLGQTLMHVRSLFWIVADDSESCSPHLDKLLDSLGKLMFISGTLTNINCFDRNSLRAPFVADAFFLSLSQIHPPRCLKSTRCFILD